jgi:hypothetical protein
MACNPEHKNRIAGLLLYSLVISLYSPETQPTWLPIFTACQPLKALATYHSHSAFLPLPVAVFASISHRVFCSAVRCVDAI